MHEIAVLILPDVIPFDFATPIEIFRCARLADGSPAYRVRICGSAKRVSTSEFTLELGFGLGLLARADTIVLPGIRDVNAPIPPEVIRALRSAARRGARIASICTGAFILAATGLLDGRRATTHWIAADQLARSHPDVQIDPNVLFVDDGDLLSSAGATAGIDLCLHLVRRDFGAAVAARVARLSVVALEREGGQAQFIERPQTPLESGSLAPLVDWMQGHLRNDLSLAVLARRAGMSSRSLSRHFRAQIGATPAQWVIGARIRRAQALLETTAHDVERIAQLVGFASAAALRLPFTRIVGTTPTLYRRSFRGRAVSGRNVALLRETIPMLTRSASPRVPRTRARRAASE